MRLHLSIIAIALLGFVFVTALSSPKALVLKGSDTVLPVGQMVAEEYMKKYPGKFVSVTGGGSGVGIAALLDGTCDIAMASRAPEGKEEDKAQLKGDHLKTHVIGYDGIAVIVNPSNPIHQLTIDEIAAIYTGQITNWKQLGGADLKIVVVSREISSGTFVYFREHVLKNKDYHASVLLLPATASVVQTVKSNKAAIGYIGLAYLKEGIKGIAVAESKEKPYVKPSPETIHNKSYAISRPLFLVTLHQGSSSGKEFIDFVMGSKGQDIIRQIGYIPVR